ncbi:MAG: type III-A CRISPR-associated protein Csm2 [Bacteroidota bacterium]
MAGSQHSQDFRGGGNRGGYIDRADATIAGKTFSGWKPFIKQWVEIEIDKDTIVFAEAMGKALKDDGLTTSQIRNVFGEMRKIQMNGFEKEKSKFLLLRAKLAYATKRQQARGMDKFYELFCEAYDAVDTKSSKGNVQFDKLLHLMEAVLAYHKFYGGQ